MKTLKQLMARLSKMRKKRKPSPKRKYDPKKKFVWGDGDITIEKSK